MARPKKNIIRTSLTLDEQILSELELYIMDPTRVPPRPIYGAMSTIVNRLLSMLLVELRRPGNDPVEVFKRFGIDLNRHSTETTESKE